jgi:hypothetical protein
MVMDEEIGAEAPPVDDERGRSTNAPRLPGTRRLKNWRHEEFAAQVASDVEPVQAYVLAGLKAHRANFHRLLNKPHIAARIEFLRRERETAARAARVQIERVLDEFSRRGVVKLADLFERNAAGILAARDLSGIPVEVSTAFQRAIAEALGVEK